MSVKFCPSGPRQPGETEKASPKLVLVYQLFILYHVNEVAVKESSNGI